LLIVSLQQHALSRLKWGTGKWGSWVLPRKGAENKVVVGLVVVAVVVVVVVGVIFSEPHFVSTPFGIP